ncbi:MAG: hypothetical protein QHC90_18720 [Shinella sp.]|jgi:hypothetical protein|nr:hypothetical protein [Shinella sp.]
MIHGAISLFGFDLFAWNRCVLLKEKRDRPETFPNASHGKQTDLDQERLPDRSESFFWGMYPVY